MELHRLDGLNIDGHQLSGLDNIDIQDVDFETLEESEFSGHQLEALEALGYVHEPEIAYEILDEEGNVIMYADADENLYVVDGLGELGFFKKIGRGIKKAASFVGKKVIRPVHRKVIKPVGKGISSAAKFTGKKILKPALKTFNRFLNPATILLRNGFLLAMKINLMKVAERLRFGYLSDVEARKRGMSMSGFSKLQGAISKANKIYELAGGKSGNLKKAILTGKGNKDRSVPLSGVELGSPMGANQGYADEFERMVVEMDAEDVESLLQGTMEIEGLGAVATGSAIAAASGAVATVSSLLNKITGVFDKGKKVVDDVKKVQNDVQNLRSKASSLTSQGRSLINFPRTVSSRFRPTGGAAPPKIPTVRRLPTRSTTTVRSRPVTTTRSTPRTIPTSTATNAKPVTASTKPVLATASPSVQITNDPEEKENFFQKNKKPLLIGAGVLVVGGGVYYAVQQSKKGKKSKGKTVDGIPRPGGLARDSKGRFKGTGNRKSTSKSKKSKGRKTQKKLVPTALL
ncbi:MAG: hypothetical protein AAGA02_00170 [Bacteroidota bacterium]